MKCTRLGCDEPATGVVRPQYGRDVPVCDAHGPGWLEVESKFENRQSFGATLVAL